MVTIFYIFVHRLIGFFVPIIGNPNESAIYDCDYCFQQSIYETLETI